MAGAGTVCLKDMSCKRDAFVPRGSRTIAGLLSNLNAGFDHNKGKDSDVN